MRLCRMFHCLPSELEREDVGYILRGLELMDLSDALTLAAQPDGWDRLTAEQKRLVGDALELDLKWQKKNSKSR